MESPLATGTGTGPVPSAPTRKETPSISPGPLHGSALGEPGRVLIVDDDPMVRSSIRRLMEAFGHETEEAADGIEALAKLPLDFDLVMLDAAMPNMDGFEVAERIRALPSYADLPIIMVTGRRTAEDRIRAVKIGINDFVDKPFEPQELKLRSASVLKLKKTQDALKAHQAELETLIDRRTTDLRRALVEGVEARREAHEAHLDTIRRLVRAAEYKDRGTGSHIDRIGRFSELVAEALGMTPREVEIIRHAAPMHDVGKIGIPDSILLKPGSLTPEEWEVMRRHTVIGAEILKGSPSEILQAGAEIALTHHEKWDGSGYPQGLTEGEIPLGGRICAVVDFFDALTSDRRYRTRGALPNQEVYQMMEEERGSHFDPRVLDAFLARRKEIEKIQEAHRDFSPFERKDP